MSILCQNNTLKKTKKIQQTENPNFKSIFLAQNWNLCVLNTNMKIMPRFRVKVKYPVHIPSIKCLRNDYRFFCILIKKNHIGDRVTVFFFFCISANSYKAQPKEWDRERKREDKNPYPVWREAVTEEAIVIAPEKWAPLGWRRCANPCRLFGESTYPNPLLSALGFSL